MMAQSWLLKLVSIIILVLLLPLAFAPTQDEEESYSCEGVVQAGTCELAADENWATALVSDPEGEANFTLFINYSAFAPLREVNQTYLAYFEVPDLSWLTTFCWDYSLNGWLSINRSPTGLGEGTKAYFTYPVNENCFIQNDKLQFKFEYSGQIGGEIDIWEEYLNYTNYCDPPSSGNWMIQYGINCSLNSAETITGNLNISNGSLKIQASGALTVSGGYVYIYPGSNLTMLSGGQLNG